MSNQGIILRHKAGGDVRWRQMRIAELLRQRHLETIWRGFCSVKEIRGILLWTRRVHVTKLWRNASSKLSDGAIYLFSQLEYLWAVSERNNSICKSLSLCNGRKSIWGNSVWRKQKDLKMHFSHRFSELTKAFRVNMVTSGFFFFFQRDVIFKDHRKCLCKFKGYFSRVNRIDIKI